MSNTRARVWTLIVWLVVSVPTLALAFDRNIGAWNDLFIVLFGFEVMVYTLVLEGIDNHWT